MSRVVDREELDARLDRSDWHLVWCRSDRPHTSMGRPKFPVGLEREQAEIKQAKNVSILLGGSAAYGSGPKQMMTSIHVWD